MSSLLLQKCIMKRWRATAMFSLKAPLHQTQSTPATAPLPDSAWKARLERRGAMGMPSSKAPLSYSQRRRPPSPATLPRDFARFLWSVLVRCRPACTARCSDESSPAAPARNIRPAHFPISNETAQTAQIILRNFGMI